MSVPLGMVPSEIQEVNEMKVKETRKIVARVENMTLLDFIYLKDKKLARMLEKSVWEYKIVMPVGLDDVPIMTVYVKEFEYCPMRRYEISLV